VPTGIVRGGDAKDDENQRQDLQDVDSLGVEAGDSGGLECVVDDEGRRRSNNITRTRHRWWRRDTDDVGEL
jgi:hypothetical protein